MKNFRRYMQVAGLLLMMALFCGLMCAGSCNGTNEGVGGEGTGDPGGSDNVGGTGNTGGTTTPTPFGAPQNPSATPGYESVTIQWNPVTDATSYNIYWLTTAGVNKSNGTKIEGVSSPYQHNNLTANTSYYYVITATGASSESNASQEVSAKANYPLLKMFVTSAAGSGDLHSWNINGWSPAKKGIDAGDEICQHLADKASLKGTFRAWLSDDNNDAYCRMHNLTGKVSSNCSRTIIPVEAGPWVRTDGSPFSETIEKILFPDYNIYLPARYDESGKPLAAGTQYFTNTKLRGVKNFDAPCDNWTNSANQGILGVGSVGLTGESWTFSSADNFCTNNNMHLVCFRTDKGAGLPTFSTISGAKKIFVTSATGNGNLSTWPQAGGKTGIEAADAICQKLARNARFETTFKAWISDDSINAKDRITGKGPWVRPDGILIANNKDDLLDGSLNAPINLTEARQYIGDTLGSVWTGSNENGTKTSNNCGNWSGIKIGDQGQAINADAGWSVRFNDGCDGNESHLYCFEQ